MKSRGFTFHLLCAALTVLFVLTSCGNDTKPTTIDSVNSNPKVDSATSTDTAAPKPDTTLPFEQDTHLIKKTIDILDSIRQAKYN